MEPIIETGTDVVTVISEPGALTFATRKEWQPLPEIRLDELEGFSVEMAFKGTGSVYFLLDKYTAPLRSYNLEIRYLLVKVSDDEEGKQVFHCMDISSAERDQLKKNRLTLWD